MAEGGFAGSVPVFGLRAVPVVIQAHCQTVAQPRLHIVLVITFQIISRTTT